MGVHLARLHVEGTWWRWILFHHATNTCTAVGTIRTSPRIFVCRREHLVVWLIKFRSMCSCSTTGALHTLSRGCRPATPAAFCNLPPLISRGTFVFAGTLGAETGGVPPDAETGAAGHGGDVLAGAPAAAPAPGTAPVANSSCIPLAGSGCSGAAAGAS